MDKRQCEYCGAELVRHRHPKYGPERPADWAARRFCGLPCSRLGRRGEKRNYKHPMRDMVLQYVQNNPHVSFEEIAEELRIATRSVRNAWTVLRGKGLYVSGWLYNDRRGGPMILVSAGDKKDRRRPKRISASERTKKWQQKNAAILKAKRRARNGVLAQPFR